MPERHVDAKFRELREVRGERGYGSPLTYDFEVTLRIKAEDLGVLNFNRPLTITQGGKP